jgi:hypothetical protein
VSEHQQPAISFAAEDDRPRALLQKLTEGTGLQAGSVTVSQRFAHDLKTVPVL